MSKIAIVTDSTACLHGEIAEKYSIYMNYLSIIFGNDSYREFQEITPSKFVELLHANEELPSTSQPAIGVTVELYEKIFADGYDEIIHLTISSALSGTYASAMSAAEMVNSEKIHLFDTKALAYQQGSLAIEAAEMVQAGKSVDEILTRVELLREGWFQAAVIDDLTNLKKGGRISSFSASLGSMLQVKPVIGVRPNGMLEPTGKVRTFKKALKFLVDKAKEANLDPEKDEIGILHMENPEAAAQIKAGVLEVYPNIKIVELPLSLVVAVHAGPGAASIGWVRKSQ